MNMKIRVLDRISVTIDGVEVRLGDRKQRAVLGILALDRGWVEKGRLASLVWDLDRGPQNPDAQIQGYLKGIRKAFDEAVPGSSRLITTLRGVGYQLEIGAASVDYLRFRELAALAAAAGLEDPEAAVRFGRKALAEWGDSTGVRGRMPLEASEPPLENLAEAMRQEYQVALMACLHADMARGRHKELIPELARLAGHDSYGAENEELARIRMLAYHRAGEGGRAYEVFDRLRHTLVKAFGSDPTKETSQLKDQIIKDDPALLLPETAEKEVENEVNPEGTADPAAEIEQEEPEPEVRERPKFMQRADNGQHNKFFQAETLNYNERDEV